MKPAALVVLALVGAGGAWAAARKYQLAQPGNEYAPDSGIVDSVTSAAADAASWIQQNAEEVMSNAQPLGQGIYLPSQMAAMRATIRQSEGTAGQGDPYRVCYGYRHAIASFSDHPAVTGEWRGEVLPDGMCSAVGLGPGCVSTAAGAYQIKKSTWLAVRDKLDLPDFTPASQDAACDELLRQRGAVEYLQRGDFAGAVNAARKEWASLPGAGYGQGERTVAWLQDRFTAAGGAVA